MVYNIGSGGIDYDTDIKSSTNTLGMKNIRSPEMPEQFRSLIHVEDGDEGYSSEEKDEDDLIEEEEWKLL